MDPYGSVWAHIKIGRSPMAQDNFRTPPDPQKGHGIIKNPQKHKTSSRAGQASVQHATSLPALHQSINVQLQAPYDVFDAMGALGCGSRWDVIVRPPLSPLEIRRSRNLKTWGSGSYGIWKCGIPLLWTSQNAGHLEIWQSGNVESNNIQDMQISRHKCKVQTVCRVSTMGNKKQKNKLNLSVVGDFFLWLVHLHFCCWFCLPIFLGAPIGSLCRYPRLVAI